MLLCGCYFVVILSCFSTVYAQNSDLIDQILSNLSPDDLVSLLNQANDILINSICLNGTVSNSTLGEENLCVKQLNVVCDNEFVYSRMADASSKLPYSGMLVESKLDLGNWDECTELDISANGTRVIGKHCTGAIVIPTTELDDPNFVQEAYKLSICVPDGCTARDLRVLLNIDPELPLINDYSCSTKDTWKKMETIDYFCISLFVLFAIFFLITTSYDAYCCQKGQDNKYLVSKAFSFYSNGKNLFNVPRIQNPEQVQVINGLKVISMMWIVLAHSFSLIATIPVTYESWLEQLQYSWGSFYYTSAYLAVDTFFFISGFLLAYQYLKQNPKPLKSHLKNVPFLYFQRYLRVTPAVFAAYLFLIGIYSHLGQGPLFHSYLKPVKDPCIKYWWSFFLYLQNYVNYNEICIIQTWYLSADFQLFLISPIIFIPVAILAQKHFKSIMVSLLLLTFVFTVVPMTLAIVYDHFDNTFESHTRLNVYFLGFTLGAFMRHSAYLPNKLNSKLNVIIWTVVLTLMTAVVFTYKFVQLLIHDGLVHYTALFILLRYIWGIGLSWIIYSCHNGHGGFLHNNG